MQGIFPPTHKRPRSQLGEGVQRKQVGRRGAPNPGLRVEGGSPQSEQRRGLCPPEAPSGSGRLPLVVRQGWMPPSPPKLGLSLGKLGS